MGLLPDDVDFDSPWSDASDDLSEKDKRIASLEAENERLREAIECALPYMEPNDTRFLLQAALEVSDECR
jgi:hypothetical protein